MARILIVDDSQLDRMLVAGLIRSVPQHEVSLAEDGREALDCIARRRPDLVITDLVMPGMDGIQLIREIRDRYPDIPVVLMTGYGNEATAAEALRAGAASYVPKAMQAERLLETVQRILARLEAERRHIRLAEYITELHCCYALDNDPALIGALIDELQSLMAGIGLGDSTDRVRAAIALEEASINALCHGNLEISDSELRVAGAYRDAGRLERLAADRRLLPGYRARKIHFEIHITRQAAQFCVTDEGHGFDLAATSMRCDRDCFETGHGRGLMLIRSLVDEVEYNDVGNQVTLIKHAPAAHAGVASPVGI